MSRNTIFTKIVSFIIFVFLGGMVIFSGNISVQAQSTESSKLEIFFRNSLAENGDDWGDDVLLYFHYLRAKHPENTRLQDILGEMLEKYETEGAIYTTTTTTAAEKDASGTLAKIAVSPKAVFPKSESVGLPELVEEGIYDEDLVEKTWIGWVNDEIRIPRGLTPLTSEFKLRETCRDRSLSLREKGIADHKRTPQASYYDYKAITKRFANRDVEFENHNRATSTENIGRARHTCSSGDCTDAVIQDIRRIYDYFASEESYNGVHRRTMIHPQFRIVGISFAIDHKADKVFAVMHYGTKLK